MNPVLHITSWPGAIESVLPRDKTHVGWVGEKHEAYRDLIFDSLLDKAVEPIEFFVFSSEESLATTQNDNVTICDLRSSSAGPILAALDVVILPQSAMTDWRDLLARWAIPPLILSDGSSVGELGVTVIPNEVAAVAAMAALLITDPPTRRKSLDLLRGSPCHRKTSVRCQIEGVFDSSYSLALVNRQLAISLDRDASIDASLLTYEQGLEPELQVASLSVKDRELIGGLWAKSDVVTSAPDIALRNAWPPVVRGMRGHLRVLANYHWEETRFPGMFARSFNNTLDLITVGSSQTAKFLVDAGVNVPIAVVGDAVDHIADRTPAPPPEMLPEGFRFLHVSSCFPRKAVDVILAAFGQAFDGDSNVALVIKTFPNPHNDVQKQVETFRSDFPDGPVVVPYESDWTDEHIAGLYQSCDAYVAPSRGEGFGLPLAEAMVHGLPVITSDWGGQRDFCSEQNSWLVPTRLGLATTHLSDFGSLWAEPDPIELASIMRAVYEQRSAPDEMRALAADATVKHLTWSQVARKTRSALDQISLLPGPLPLTRVGWMSSWGIRCGIASYSRHMTTSILPGRPLASEFELHVLAPHDTLLEQNDEPFVTRCWQRAAVKPHRDLIRYAVVARLDALVIQYHWSFFSPEVLVDTINALTGAGVAVFLDMHNTRGAPASVTANPALVIGLDRCARVLVHSLDDVSRAESWGIRDNITLFPLASYPVTLPSEASVKRRASELDLDGKTVIASYGFLMAHKGIVELVEAMPAILEARPDAHLLLVNALYSDDVSGPVMDALEYAIARLGLAEHVTHISDYLSDQESLTLLKLSDMVVFPYRNSAESSSASVRMGISARSCIAVTPITLFSDIASGCYQLPGETSADIATGVLDLLEKRSDPLWVADKQQDIEKLAQEFDAVELSERLLRMMQGHLRRLEVD